MHEPQWRFFCARREAGSMTEPTTDARPQRVSPLQRAVEDRLANPLFRRLLRSRLHWTVSGQLVLVSYVGARSGHRYTFPVLYGRHGDALVAVTPRRESCWWRQFREPRPCTVWLRGTARSATGEVVEDATRERLLAAYRAAHPLAARFLGFDDGRPDRTLAVVRFRLDDGRRTGRVADRSVEQ